MFVVEFDSGSFSEAKFHDVAIEEVSAHFLSNPSDTSVTRVSKDIDHGYVTCTFVGDVGDFILIHMKYS